ncbi:cysteine hydrolase family protein [Bdellovibrio svalbardensis]|uniref:Cysteine hydrolase n=1 Tax=Bdellovibrio svalbardensis TaxID=2972972 RepID=A0ABT6DK39_9BACT|nr:cysteine hydrolase [Bdellovibrio svalbardensis]MDG0817241.1 cysteine hydrolase [Bdellovibrio svalbardensis]
MNTALLVIDLQVCYLELNFSPEERERIVRVTNHNIAEAHRQGWTVIYIKHYFDSFFAKMFFKIFFKGAGVRGTAKSVFDPRINIINQNLFEKNTEDTFKSTNLDAFLKEHQIDELYITGLDGTACVNATSWGALQRNYKVNLIEDSIISVSPKRWKSLLSKLQKQENCKLLPTLR